MFICEFCECWYLERTQYLHHTQNCTVREQQVELDTLYRAYIRDDPCILEAPLPPNSSVYPELIALLQRIEGVIAQNERLLTALTSPE